mgnify:FL=1
MGVKDFFKLFAGTQIKLNQLKGKVVAIDAMTEIYRSLHGINTHLTGPNGEITTHINLITMTISKFKKAGVSQIYVFDSAMPPPLKKAELERRRVARVNNLHAIKITPAMINDVRRIIQLLGIPYMIAPNGFDAEHVCAELNKTNRVDYVLSTDADVFLYGGLALLKYEKRSLMLYTREDFIQQTKIPDTNIVDAAVHLGTDFNAKTVKIGPATLIKKWPTLEKTPEQQAAADLFNTRPMLGQIVEPRPNHEELLQWLESLAFNRDRMAKLLTTD